MPNPTFNFPCNSSQRGDYYAFGASTGGGPRVQVFHQNTLIFDQFVFEPTFRGGVDVSWTKEGYLMVGAGSGGAPRVRIFDLNGGRVIKDYFAFDPADRQGILILNGVPTLGYKKKNEVVPLPKTQYYFGRPWGNVDVTTLNRNLSLLPDNIQIALNRIGYVSYVYNGRYVSEIGFTSQTVANPTTTSSFATQNFMFVADWVVSQTNHEIGHAIHFRLLPQTYLTEWTSIWTRNYRLFPGDYDRTSPLEGFAETFRRWVIGGKTFSEADAYMNRVIPVLT